MPRNNSKNPGLPLVGRKAKSIREYKKKPSSEKSNTEENKSTNLA